MRMARACRALPVMLVVSLLALAACTSQVRAAFVPNGAPLDLAAAEQLARTADLSSVSSVDVASAPAARQQVLRDLRSHGSAGDRAADLLTQGFPALTPSVPVLVRIGPFEGKQALVVVEAYGDASGRLAHRRLWVFDLASGSVLQASSYR